MSTWRSRDRAIVLTADMAAVAIVAAARAWGVDPERAFRCKGGPLRGAIQPAAEAISLVTAIPIGRLSPLLGIGRANNARSRLNGGERYARAHDAAEAALRHHLAVPGAVVEPSIPCPGCGVPCDGSAVGPHAADCPVFGPDAPDDREPPEADAADLSPPEPGAAAPQTPAPTPVKPPVRGGLVSAAAARRLVLSALQADREPATAPELMMATGLKEFQVRQALRDLRDAGDVTGTPLTAEGWRAQFWRPAKAAAR